MLAPFYFSDFEGEKLLTNDTGAYFFMQQQDFMSFVKGELPVGSDLFRKLEAEGFCYSGSEEGFLRVSGADYANGNSYLYDPTSLFIFALTNECNNRCVYCQANGSASPCRMTVDVADKALKQIAACPASSLTIEFQGGEPLLNFSVIRYIVLHASEYMPRKDIRFSLVSNLALMTDEIAAFLGEHHVSVSTSLDGPEDIHDWNRPAADGGGSFRAMLRGRGILLRHGISPGAIETTTALSLQNPERVVRSYAENGFHQIFLRPLTRLGAAAQCWDQIGYTPDEFLDFYRKALAEIIRYNRDGFPMMEYHAALFLSKMLNHHSRNYMELRSPCGAGLGQIAITAHGNVYTCDEGRMIAETGDDAFCIGSVFEGTYSDWIESSCCKAVCSASLLETLPGCCDCIFKPYCGVCPVVNYAINGSIARKSADRCRIYAGMMSTLFSYLKTKNPEVLVLFRSWADQA